MADLYQTLVDGPSDVWDGLSHGEQAELRRLILLTLHMPWVRYLEERQEGVWEGQEERFVRSHNYRWFLERYDVPREEVQNLVRFSTHVPLIYIHNPDSWPGVVHHTLACRTGDLRVLSRAVSYILAGHPVWSYEGSDPEGWYQALVGHGVGVHLMPWLFRHPTYYPLLSEYTGPVDYQTDLIGYLVECYLQGASPCEVAVHHARPRMFLERWWSAPRTLEETRALTESQFWHRICDGDPVPMGSYLIYLTAYHSNWLSDHHGDWSPRPVNIAAVEQLEELAGEECHYDGCVVSRLPKPDLRTIYQYRGYHVGVGGRYHSDSTVHERAIDRLISGLQPALLQTGED